MLIKSAKIKVEMGFKHTPITILEMFKFGSQYQIHIDQATHEISFNHEAIKRFYSYLSTGYKYPIKNKYSSSSCSFMHQKFKTLKLAQFVFNECELWSKDPEYYIEH